MKRIHLKLCGIGLFDLNNKPSVQTCFVIISTTTLAIGVPRKENPIFSAFSVSCTILFQKQLADMELIKKLMGQILPNQLKEEENLQGK